jgi:branched-chain amino acid transport system ATP-binding protein
MPILKVDSVSKSYGGVHALSDVSFSVDYDQFYAVIGPNGAGKSTLLNVLTALTPPTSGGIHIDGKDMRGLKTHQIIAAGVGRTFQSGRMFQRLTVQENVMMGFTPTYSPSIVKLMCAPFSVASQEKKLQQRSLELLDSFGLVSYANHEIGSLSYGNRRLVEIVRVIAAQPKLLLLDEPAAGLNLGEVQQLSEILNALRNQHKMSIVLIEHNMSMVMRLAERITVLNFGKKIAEGTPLEIQSDDAVLKAYLGEGYQHATL